MKSPNSTREKKTQMDKLTKHLLDLLNGKLATNSTVRCEFESETEIVNSGDDGGGWVGQGAGGGIQSISCTLNRRLSAVYDKWDVAMSCCPGHATSLTRRSLTTPLPVILLRSYPFRIDCLIYYLSGLLLRLFSID